MPGKLDIDDIILNFDPAAPQQRFRTVGLEAAFLLPPRCRAQFPGRRMPRPKPPHLPSRRPKRTTSRAFMAMTRWS